MYPGLELHVFDINNIPRKTMVKELMVQLFSLWDTETCSELFSEVGVWLRGYLRGSVPSGGSKHRRVAGNIAIAFFPFFSPVVSLLAHFWSFLSTGMTTLLFTLLSLRDLASQSDVYNDLLSRPFEPRESLDPTVEAACHQVLSCRTIFLHFQKQEAMYVSESGPGYE